MSGFHSAQEARAGDRDKLTLMKCFRIYNEELARDFIDQYNEGEGAREAKVVTMWMCCGINDATKIFQGAMDDDFVLFSDPMMASEVGSFENGSRGVLSGAADEVRGRGARSDEALRISRR